LRAFGAGDSRFNRRFTRVDGFGCGLNVSRCGGLLLGFAGLRAGDSRFNGRFTRVDGFGGGLNVSRCGGLLLGFAGLRAGDSRFNGRFTRVDGFGGGLNVSRCGGLLLGFAGLRAGDSRFNGRFTRVGSLGGGLFRLLILLRQLAGAGLGFTGFAGGDRFTVIRFRSGLDNDRLGGIALFFANPGQRGVNRRMIFRGRLNSRLFVAFQTRGFVPLQASLAGLKAGFGLRRALFFLTDSRNLGLFLTEILYQRNITRTDPGAGAALDAVGQVMGGGFIVLLAFAEPVQLLRQQIGRTGVRTGATANTAFFFLGSPISLADGASRQLVILTTGTSSHGRVNPISGPPIMTICSALGQKPASSSRWRTGVPSRAHTLPGRVTASPVRVTTRSVSGSPSITARLTA
jgi:hypothetical protein